MKTYTVRITNKARKQYLGIYDYIKNVLKSSQAAKNLMSSIDLKIKSLDTLPNMYTSLKSLNVKFTHMRYVTAKNFNIIYAVDDAKLLVTVYAIVYCRSNLNTILESI